MCWHRFELVSLQFSEPPSNSCEIGEVLDSEYYMKDGDVYSKDAYFRLFGERCATCCEVSEDSPRDQGW